MQDYFRDKTLLITGASTGIGRDLALLLASYRTRLALVARRAPLLEELQAACTEAGAEVKIFPADVTDEGAMLAIRDQLLADWSLVDIVVANAGVGGLNPADKFSAEINRKTMEINFFGMINTLAPFIPSMVERRQGQLVGVSSLAAFRGLPNAASYSSSKAAQARLLESWRVDLRRHGVSVSCIHPGFIETPMTQHDRFRMPFMVPVRKSSLLIAKAIRKRRSVYLYPWPMRILTFLNRILPNFIYDRLVPRLTGQREIDQAIML
ncbi:MAG: SDR family NAD(P)-dependent oxidoreductase [Bradymonadales bacterium]|nr:SDR family NAD(P)-dependent oxidoreductase [Bradymonadales bacterium]